MPKDNKELGSDESSKEAAEDKTKNDDENPEAAQEDQGQYPSSWRLVLITIALCLCVFCVSLVCQTLGPFCCR